VPNNCPGNNSDRAAQLKDQAKLPFPSLHPQSYRWSHGFETLHRHCSSRGLPLASIGLHWPPLASIGLHWPPLASIGLHWPPLASMGTGKRLSCDGLHIPSSRVSGWLALVSIRPPASLAPIRAPLRSVVSHRSSGAIPAQHGRHLISNLAAIQLLNRDYLHAHNRVSLCLLNTCVSNQTSSSRRGLQPRRRGCLHKWQYHDQPCSSHLASRLSRSCQGTG